MEDLVVNGLDVKPINYIAEKVHIVTIVPSITINNQHCFVKCLISCLTRLLFDV